MARYRIETPNGDYSGDVAGVPFTGGVAEVTDPAPGALGYFRAAGYSVTEQTAARPPAPSEQGPERPADSDRKAAWTAYAEHVGVEPAGLTKDQLIDAVEEAEA